MIPSSGVIVVADTNNHRIRLISPLGITSTLAGSGSAAFADGTGASASFYYPAGVAVIPSSGVIVVADRINYRIRLISPLGVVTTLAGSGSAAFADGMGAAASFNDPLGVAVIPSSGIIVVADYSNHRIRLISSLGVVTTLAGSGSAAFADGTGASASFNYPFGVAVIPSSGVIVVADYNNHRIRIISLPLALPACDSTWHHVALTYSPSALPDTLSAFLDGAVAFTAAAAITLPPASASTLRVGWSGDLAANSGSLFSGSLAELRIYNRSLSAAEVLALSQPPLAAYYAAAAVSPAAPTLGATSYTFACTAAGGFSGASLAKSAADGSWAFAGGAAPVCASCAAGSSSPSASASATGCVACGAGSYSYGAAACAGCAAGATLASAAAGCAPLASQTAGPADTVFYLSGSAAEGVGAFPVIRAPPGVSFVSGPFGAANGALALASGSYLGALGSATPSALPAAGSAAWTASAWVQCPQSTAWAAALEWGAAGDVGGVAAPQALALGVVGSASGAFFGATTTLAGSGAMQSVDGAGLSASFFEPSGLALLSTSNTSVVVAELGGGVRLLNLITGAVTTIAGGGYGFADGIGTNAMFKFNYEAAIAVIPSNGIIVLPDAGSNRIRLLNATSGLVTTLAGSGTYSSVDGTGAGASFTGPQGVAVAASGGVIIVADTDAHLIRLVTYPAGVVTAFAGSSSPGSFADGTASSSAAGAIAPTAPLHTLSHPSSYRYLPRRAPRRASSGRRPSPCSPPMPHSSWSIRGIMRSASACIPRGRTPSADTIRARPHRSLSTLPRTSLGVSP